MQGHFKLYQRRFRLNLRRNYFMNVIQHSDGLPRAMVQFSSLRGTEKMCGCGVKFSDGTW